MNFQKKIITLLATILLFFIQIPDVFAPSFKEQQLKYSRVRVAKSAANNYWKKRFAAKGLSFPPRKLFIRVLKSENLYEVWTTNNSNGKYKLLKTYNVCAMSGVIGPKQRQGDKQVPEGFYHISDFNPQSSYYLSLRVNYPNKADRSLSPYKGNLGGDIYIHGDCKSIGCISLTTPQIKELYWLTALARNSGQARIPVHIFPSRMSDLKYNILRYIYNHKSEKVAFWRNLKTGYDYFEKRRIPPNVYINGSGKYVFE